jgi:hypothetical protein
MARVDLDAQGRNLVLDPGFSVGGRQRRLVLSNFQFVRSLLSADWQLN